MSNGDWKHVGDIGVDSGQMMLVDPCYTLPDNRNGTYDDNSKPTYEDLLNDHEKNGYGRNAFVWKIPGDAVISSTGFGDGVYEVFVKEHDFGTWGKRVTEMKIVFISPEEIAEDSE